MRRDAHRGVRGLLDQDDPETCIAREAFEETGYEIRNRAR
jgi:8-oxo-dGTP pyrophosphatase MutT (NUDIX family)